MIMNYPMECWHLETIVNSMVKYGRLLIWNKDDSNKARILVKLRVYDIDRIPLSLVVTQSTSDEGQGSSWSCPVVILSATMLGAGPGDEDPLPPDGADPHPVPIIIGAFDIWHAENKGMQ